MDAWSYISCAQWMPPSREPSTESSNNGVRPAASRMGTRSVAALNAPQTALAVPTLVCTMTAWTRPSPR